MLVHVLLFFFLQGMEAHEKDEMFSKELWIRANFVVGIIA